MRKTVEIAAVMIVIVATSLTGCFQAIKDETNFTRPELRNYKTIVVLPFGPKESGIDSYYSKALTEHWPQATIITPDSVLARFDLEDSRSFRKARLSLEEIGLTFGADAVVEGVINTHFFTPLNKYESLSQFVVHLTVYVVDLKTSETVACYHNEKTTRTSASRYNPTKETPLYNRVSEDLATDNARGLAKLAYASGHL